MFDLILIIAGLILAYKLYHYSQNFFDDGVDYSLVSPQQTLSKHIQNNVIYPNKDAKETFFQIHNVTIPTDTGSMKIESIFVSNKGIYLFNSHSYSFDVTYSDIGYTYKNTKGQIEKLMIRPSFENECIRSLKHLFSDLSNLDISFYRVFISNLHCSLDSPENVVQLENLIPLIQSGEPLLSNFEVAYISGLLSHLQTTQIDNKINFPA
jgi:hypothetical protein